MRLVTDTFAYCRTDLPAWNTISISGYHMREAGATAVQEVAFTIANGLEYVRQAVDRGLEVDRFAPRLSFFFNSHNNFLEEIAKFRAARKMWARLMSERFGAKDPRSLALRFHAQTAGSTLTAQQPENNVVRVAYQAMAAVLGGCQSLHTNSRDEALALPTEESARIALRTQHILAFETGVADTADPLAGSYAVESLTLEIEQKALELLERIDSFGGALAATEKGWIQNEIAESAYRAQRDLEDESSIVVGVNRYVDAKGVPLPTMVIEEAIEREQVERLEAFRARRDSDPERRRRHDDALADLDAAAAKADRNLLPPILEAIRSEATIGEIVNTLRRTFGTHRDQAF